MLYLETGQITEVLNSHEYPSWESGVVLASAAKDRVITQIQDFPILVSDIRVPALLSKTHLETENWILLNAIITQDRQIVDFILEANGVDTELHNGDLIAEWATAAQRTYDADPTKGSHVELFAPLLLTGYNPMRILPDEIVNSYSKMREVCIQAVSYGDPNFPSNLFTSEIENPRKERLQSIQLLQRTIDILGAQKKGLQDLKLLFPQVESFDGLIPHTETTDSNRNTIFPPLVFDSENLVDPNTLSAEEAEMLEMIDSAGLTDLKDLTTEMGTRCKIHRCNLASRGQLIPVLIKEVKDEDQFRIESELEFYKEWRETDLQTFLLHSALPREFKMNGKSTILMLDLREVGLTLSQDGFQGDCLPILDRNTNFAYNEPARVQLEQFMNMVLNLYSKFWRMGWDIVDQVEKTKGIAARFNKQNLSITQFRLFDFGNFSKHPTHRPNDFVDFIQRIFTHFVPFHSPEFKPNGFSILFHDEKVRVPKVSKNRNFRFPNLVAKDLAAHTADKYELTSQIAFFCGISYEEATQYVSRSVTNSAGK